MKDKLNGNKIVEFVGLKSKMYSLISSDGKEINKAKGINKKLRHDEYLDVLFNKKVVRHKIKRIQSVLHKIGTYNINKISLSCFDDKRHVLNDGINTLAYFHKDIDINGKYSYYSKAFILIKSIVVILINYIISNRLNHFK